MSVEVRKRGRPRKVVEELVNSGPEEIPKPVAAPATPKRGKASSKAVSSTSKLKSVDNDIGQFIAETRSVGIAESKLRKSASKQPAAINVEDLSPPPVVARSIQLEESKILQEISKTEKKSSRTSPRARVISKETEIAKAAEVLPLKEQSNTPAAHLQPANTLAMSLPIPSFQSTTHTVGLHASHCLPWLPNPSMLTQAAYLSTTTRLQAAGKRKLPSLKEANKFVVEAQSSRGGPGSGAASLRAQQTVQGAEGMGRPELLQPGKMPEKYKPAARRVQALIVALPIVIVTSYMLYERLVLGVEPKRRPLIPSGSPPPPTPASEFESNSKS